MSVGKILLLSLLVVVVSACGTSKNIVYFQDMEAGKAISLASKTQITVKPEDRLFIAVNGRDMSLASIYNLPDLSDKTMAVQTSKNGVLRTSVGYNVGTDGCIDFPELGKLSVAGKTREQVALEIKKELTTRGLLKEPIVTVEFTNLYIAVLGEVNQPGRYAINRDHVTLLDAIGMAGDLTIYGKRKDVQVLREVDGKQVVYNLDLTKASELYSSPAYYLQQNDVVYVLPNDVRARQSTVNGNNVLSTSFWLSLGSFLVTIAVLVTK